MNLKTPGVGKPCAALYYYLCSQRTIHTCTASVGSGSADHPDCTMDAESRLTAAMAPALPKLDVSALQGAITEAKVCLDLIYLRPRAQLQCPALICVVLG